MKQKDNNQFFKLIKAIEMTVKFNIYDELERLMNIVGIQDFSIREIKRRFSKKNKEFLRKK